MHRRTLAAPELRLRNDWGFLGKYTTCVREVSPVSTYLHRNLIELFLSLQLFKVKRAFLALSKEENALEMFDPQEPHSLVMREDEGLCTAVLKMPSGVFSVADLDADERYVNAVCIFLLIPSIERLLKISSAHTKSSVGRILPAGRCILSSHRTT